MRSSKERRVRSKEDLLEIFNDKIDEFQYRYVLVPGTSTKQHAQRLWDMKHFKYIEYQPVSGTHTYGAPYIFVGCMSVYMYICLDILKRRRKRKRGTKEEEMKKS